MSGNQSQSWDVIILGLGGVGSAAVYQLAAAGLRVLGIDPNPPVHDRGSSHGRTRVIRQAYFEHPAYVPLLQRAYELWHDTERRFGEALFCRTGLIEIGPADGVVIPGVKQSASDYDLDIELVPISDVTARWPGLRVDEKWQAVLEKNAGFLKVERCVAAHLQLANQHGAVCRHGVAVHDWRVAGSGVEVTTESGIERASHLVFACGPWSGPMLKPYGVDLQVLRKYQYWFVPDSEQYQQRRGFPCFFFETAGGYYYGFPGLDDGQVKLCRHDGGQPVAEPSVGRATAGADDVESVRKFAASHLPRLGDRIISCVPCYYTMTRDEHFIVDTLPGHSQVSVVAGLSGHGFKFTAVLGEIIAKQVTGTPTGFDIGLFSISR